MALWRILWTLVRRGVPPISRYTRVLRAAHGRVKSTFHSRCGSLFVHELWLTIHLLFFRLFGVDSGQFCTFSTLNRRAWVCDTDTLSGCFCGTLTIETIASFSPSLPSPSNGSDSLLNKLLFFSLMIRWLCLSVSKYTFEVCFACSTQYFLGHLLRIFLRRFMAYLGQSCLSRPRLSVSHTPCTTSWCQPDRLLYSLPKDRLCLSPGLYG